MLFCSFFEKQQLIRVARRQVQSYSKVTFSDFSSKLYIHRFFVITLGQDIHVRLICIKCMMMPTTLLVCALLVVSPSLAQKAELVRREGNKNVKPTLKHVSVVFRHGDRAPESNELYPKDPYYKNDFYPMGIGGMTNPGKLREYEMGRALRERYGDFLGDTYLPDDVYARSTDYKRTKMCLQLVLAALYPPKGEQIWNDKLAWQPIPAEYEKKINDWLMAPDGCPEYLQEKKKVESSPEVVKKMETFETLMANLTEWTGQPINTLQDMFNAYHALIAEESMGLALPEWTKSVYPNGTLLSSVYYYYQLYSYNTAMRRLNGGKLLHSIVEDMKAVKSGKFKKSKKISIYSGHETSIVAISQAYGFYEVHVPQYSSAVLTEFYQKNSRYFVKVAYYQGIPPKIQIKNIPGCGELCPFTKFLQLLKEVIPSNRELECVKSK